jgi:hypothetical protein
MGAGGGVGDDITRRRRRHGLVERDGHVRSKRLLHPDCVLRGEPVERPVEVAAERHPIVVDHPQVAERHDLEATGIGEDRPIPGHELVQPAEPRDPLVTGAQVEVIGVGQDDRRAGSLEVIRVQRLDRRVRADRHELRRVDRAMGQLETAQAGTGRTVGGRRDEDLVAGRAPLEGRCGH